MASSSATRWKLACDTCEVVVWIGPGERGYEAWCESCQSAHTLAAAPGAGARCARCAAPLHALPRFVELWGELQHLDAVLGAWAGDPQPLATLLPERPRFVTDLDPPAALPADPPARAALLVAVAYGDYRGALASAPLGDADDARAHAARAIAHERLGDTAAALASWNAVLELAPSGVDATRARLARGSLLARAGRLQAASTDLALAGTSEAARWDRASLLVHEGVAASDGVPQAELLLRARAEAGEASAYWSDPTIGRLLWSLLIERQRAQRAAPGVALPESALATLRAAETEFEHATFWDRAMMLVGWARLGAQDEVARIAEPLAREQAAAVLDEPAVHGEALTSIATAVAAARTAIDMGDPVEARRTLAETFARADLRRFRIPCASCGRGAIGIDETLEPEAAGE